MAERWSDVFTTMIEPTTGCNLRCRYCYSDSEDGRVMSHEVLSLALEKATRHAEENGFKEIHLIWHGGEPLLVGMDFFQQAISILDGLHSSLSCRHFVQTNGLLLDDEYCRFFRDTNFEVGVSLDGPSEVHNQSRIASNGRGTHTEVMEKVHLLEKHQVPIGFNAVISQASKGKARDIYRFFQDLRYGFRVNPVIPGWGCHETQDYLLGEGDYGEFLCWLFDEWTSTEKDRVSVSPLDMHVRAILDGEATECQQLPSCIGLHLGIKPGGEAVLCSRFERHVLGDIQTMSISDLFSSPVCKQIQERTDALSGCHTCPDWGICHGGCPHNAIAFQGRFHERDPFCKDYQMIFRHIRRIVQSSRQEDLEAKTL